MSSHDAKKDLSSVIESHMCIGCGACVAVDPQLELVLDETALLYQPNSNGGKKATSVCPSISVDYAGLHKKVFPDSPVTEHGVIYSVYLAQSTNYERNFAASSGGLVKELLSWYLEQDSVDGAIALTHKEGLDFEPQLIKTPEKIHYLPGSIYHNLPFDKALRLLQDNEGCFVLVAIPCHLEGIYTYIYNYAPHLAKRIHAVIGLSCGWNYSHHALKAICAYKGTDFSKITDISYRGGGPVGKLHIRTPEKEIAVSRRVDFSYQVAFDRSFNIRRCHVCINHVNYLADIVVADAWLPSTVRTRTGISLIICRTESADAAMLSMQNRGQIRMIPATVDDITESQKRRNAFGDFAYAYAMYLKENGWFCPDLEGPNKEMARLALPKSVEEFHETVIKKKKLQQQGRYWTLWLRKATVEFPRLFIRYFNWFLVRILKIKSLLGMRKEISRESMRDFW